jgi:hypothetical protein
MKAFPHSGLGHLYGLSPDSEMEFVVSLVWLTQGKAMMPKDFQSRSNHVVTQPKGVHESRIHQKGMYFPDESEDHERESIMMKV